MLGVAIVLFVISRWREGRTAAVWGLPPLFLIWANMDTGFAAGLLILMAALLLIRPGRRQRPTSAGARARGQRSRRARQPDRAEHLRLGDRRRHQPRRRAEPRPGWASPNFHDWSSAIFEAEIILMVVLWTISGGPDRFAQS